MARIPGSHLPHRVSVTTLVAIALLASTSAAGADIVVTECGEIVPEGETAHLVADLDCRGARSEGVVLEDRATLVMAGHEIVGDPDAAGSYQGIRCATGSICTVLGPGAIRGFSASGIAGTRVRARGVAIAGNGRMGIVAYENVRLRDVVITENGLYEILAGGRVRARRSVVEGDGAVVEQHSPRFSPS